MLDTLLTPLRLPGRVVDEIEKLSRVLVSLQKTAEKHLSSVDDRAGELVKGVIRLQASVTGIDRKVERLMGLEATIDERMETLRGDLNTRMLAVEAEVHAIRGPM